MAISASFVVMSALNSSDRVFLDTEMSSTTMMPSTESARDLDSGPVVVTPTPLLSEEFLTSATSVRTLSDIVVESPLFTSPTHSYFSFDLTPTRTHELDSSSLYYTPRSSQSVYLSTISHTPAVTTIAISSVFSGDTSRTNTTESSLPTFPLTPTPYVPPVTSTTTTPPSVSPVIQYTTPGPSASTTTMNPTTNGTTIGHPPPQATSLPLAVLIALPVCIGVLLILAVATILYIVHRRRRRKAGNETETKRTKSELWLNTSTQLPPLPPSPVSLGNGHIVPLTHSETELKPVKDHLEGVTKYEVIHEFQAPLEEQLTLTMGQKITVKEKADNGWWRGCHHGHGDNTGWFPGEYVKEIHACGRANGEKSKFNQVDHSLDVEETDVSFVTHPIKPGVSSFLIRKKGQEDKSPADLVKENKQRKHSATDQNGNGVTPNSNVGGACTQPEENTTNMANKLNVIKSSEQGSSSDSLPVYSDSDVRRKGQRYSAIYPYTADRDGEISLQENDVVVYLEEGSIGWIRGRKEVTDEEGWVPASYLQQANAEASRSQLSLAEACHQIQDQLHTNKRLSLATEHFIGIEHRALYGYVAQHPEDLSFEAGDIIVVLDALENGWWHGLKGEEFGWFPGSFVEILEGGGDSPPGDLTDSLSSSQNSSYADLLKNLNEELASKKDGDTLSMGSISTVGSDEGKLKPVRKAPAPPSGKGSIKQTSRKKRVMRRPSRPAPPPPPPPSDVVRGDKPLTENVDTPVIVVNGKDKDDNPGTTSLDNGETTQKKPPLPRRFVKPKLVKISKKRLKLQNSAALPVAPSRPVPPRPPAPRASSVKKFASKSSKKDKSLDSRSSLSGNKLKKSDISSPMVLEHTTMKTEDIVVQPVVSGQAETSSGTGPRAEAILHDQKLPEKVQVSSPGTTDEKNPVRKRLSSPGPPVAPKPKYHMSSPEDKKSHDNNNLSPEISHTSLTAGNPVDSLMSDRSHLQSESVDPHRQSNFSAINVKPENIAAVPVPRPRRRNSSENELDSPGTDHEIDFDSASQLKANFSGMEESIKHKYVKRPRPPSPKSPPPPTKISSTDEVETRSRQKKKSLKKTIHAYKGVREGELSFEEGSFIKEMDEVSDRPGWCVGMLADGTVGTFHKSHVDDTTINRQSTA